MNRYNFLIFVALLAIVITIPIYGSMEITRLSQAKDDLQAQSVENGIVLYLEFCVDCHGPGGEGTDLNPALNRLGMADADPDLLFKVIARAAHGSSMASWHLGEGGVFNDYQIRELVTLIRFGDWSRVQLTAADKGIEDQGISTRNISEIAINIMAEEDPHQCISCHEDPQVHKEKFGLDCVRCHSLQAWIPASLTRHSFQLDHGDEGNLACEICHTETYAENTCYECHDHQPEEMAEVHETEGIQEFDNCQSCHPTGVKDEGREIWQEFLDINQNNNLSATSTSSQ
ncbi:c-type cytochrome [Chloroflexota bacterium]